MPSALLTDTQIERYSRQLILPEIGAAGQHRLLAGGVALVGARASTTPALLYLAGAGVGRLGVMAMTSAPHDDRLSSVLCVTNPDTTVTTLPPGEDIVTLLRPYAAVIDASDNAAVHARLNQACLALAIPLILGTVHGHCGRLTTLAGHRADTPCYACVATALAAADNERTPDNGLAAGLLGTLQATEALKALLSVGSPLYGELLTYDAVRWTFDYARLDKHPACTRCAFARHS